MSSSTLSSLTAIEISDLVKARKVSAEEIIQQTFAQIERIEPKIHSWVHLASDVALRHAREVDAKVKAGEPVGRLAGVPVGVKDIFNTAEMPTQMGSPLWKGFTPGNDARVVWQIRNEGAVFPGKTVTAEFAVHTPGPTCNPHDVAHMPGTSSSGSAAAVAAQMVPLTLGTQTAGSIIRPASYNGIYGYKPSFGLIARTAMLKTTDSLDSVGYFGKSVEDMAVMFDIMRLHGRDYPISHEALSDKKRQSKGDGPWKVGVIENAPKWDHAEPYAKEALAAYVAKLERTPGVEVVKVRLPDAYFRAHDVHGVIYDKTLSYYFKEEFNKKTLISPVMYEICTRGYALSLDEYKKALAEQDALAASFDDQIQSCHAWLTLSTGGAALKGLESVDRPDTALIWTMVGAPVMNLPVFAKDHLPFGAQLIGRKYNDYLLFDLMRHLEKHELIGKAPNPVPALARG